MLKKRKRKNSVENAPAPRATRQRRLPDDGEKGDSTVLERTTGSPGTPEAPEPPKTPATGRRTTRKKNLVTYSQDLTMLTNSRKTVVSKSSSDSVAEDDVGRSRQKLKRAVSKRMVADVETHSMKSRAKKDPKDVENTKRSSIPKQNRRTRKKRALTSANNTIAESPNSVKTPVKSTMRSQAAKSVTTRANPLTESTESHEQLGHNKISIVGRIQDTPRKISPRKHSSPLIQLSVDTITPKSSPIPVNLTPHRSSKTPKKSPLNISSPKTHSQLPLRLSKTPRKLTVSVESPATSDKSSVSMFTQNLKKPGVLSPENQCNSHVLLVDFMKEGSPSNQQDSKSLSKFVARDKTPTNLSSSLLTVDEIWAQVVANSPNARCSRRLGVPGSKIRRSPVKTPALVRKLEAVGTPLKNRVSTLLKTPADNRLSNLINSESPKRLRSTTKKNSPGTPRPIFIAEESPGDELAGVVSVKTNLLEADGMSPGDIPRDQPRRSLRLTPDFTKFSADSTSSPIATRKETVRVLPQVFHRSEESKDESLELLDCNEFVDVSDLASGNEDDQTEKNGTYRLSKNDYEGDKKDLEGSEKPEAHNATYELAEPKTPNLRRTSRKRLLSKVESSHCTPESKRRCRVRFATPSQEAQVKISADALGLSKKSLPTANTPTKQRLQARLSHAGVHPGSSKRRSRSLTKIEDKISSTKAGAKRRSNSASAVSAKTPKLSRSIQSSVNRLSRPRQSVNSEAKSEIKVSVPRRIPNFAQIHQKKFEKMESLVDAKKRVAKRHEELNTAPTKHASPLSSSAPAATVSKKRIPPPSERQNSGFTRFGFNLRKVEAVKMMSKKAPATATTKNHVVSNRSVLKGVRTNKRFELQLKFRKITDDER